MPGIRVVGWAMLTLDDRGVGESSGDWTGAGHELLVADGLSAAEVLARHPRSIHPASDSWGCPKAPGLQ